MPNSESLPTELQVDRRRTDRRKTERRRTTQAKTAAEEKRQGNSDRRKTERRRQIDPTTCERDYSQDEIDFMRAMDEYKRKSNRQFPTWSEVLEVLRAMGYRKVAEPTEILPKPKS